MTTHTSARQAVILALVASCAWLTAGSASHPRTPASRRNSSPHAVSTRVASSSIDIAGGGAGVINGGPFKRVVYRFATHITLATPGLFRESGLEFRAPSIQYNDLNHVAWATGPCFIRSGASTATASAATADFARHTVTLTNGVQFQVNDSSNAGKPVNLSLHCPSVFYNSDTGVVQCTGGVSGQVSGVADLPGAVITSQGSSIPSGPLTVSAPNLTYNSKSRMLQATGGIRLAVNNATVQCPTLSLDVTRRLLRMEGGISYSDTAGRRLTGSQASDDLRRQVVSLTGPVRYSDGAGNQVQAPSAVLDQRNRSVSFTGGVQFRDPHGLQAQTPYATIQFDPKGVKGISTGPLNVTGVATAPAG